MTEDPGVMGNLPRSRPGRRSEKRAGKSGSGAAKSGASKARSARATAKKSAGSAKRGAAAAGGAARSKPAAGAARPRPPVKTPPRGPDPVGDAVRVATKLAGAGIGVATAVLKRLPRP